MEVAKSLGANTNVRLVAEEFFFLILCAPNCNLVYPHGTGRVFLRTLNTFGFGICDLF